MGQGKVEGRSWGRKGCPGPCMEAKAGQRGVRPTLHFPPPPDTRHLSTILPTLLPLSLSPRPPASSNCTPFPSWSGEEDGEGGASIRFGGAGGQRVLGIWGMDRARWPTPICLQRPKGRPVMGQKRMRRLCPLICARSAARVSVIEAAGRKVGWAASLPHSWLMGRGEWQGNKTRTGAREPSKRGCGAQRGTFGNWSGVDAGP